MRKLLLGLPLMLALGGCANQSVQNVLGEVATTLGTISTVAGTASNVVAPLCAQVSALSLTVSQSGLVNAKTAAAIAAGQNHYNTYCGPAALDAAIVSTAAAQLQADIAALQAL